MAKIAYMLRPLAIVAALALGGCSSYLCEATPRMLQYNRLQNEAAAIKASIERGHALQRELRSYWAPNPDGSVSLAEEVVERRVAIDVAKERSRLAKLERKAAVLAAGALAERDACRAGGGRILL